MRTGWQSYPRESYMFVTASLVNSVGSSLMWPLITIYVHNVLGRSYGEAGFVLFCQSFAAILGQFIGGSLFHKLGPKRLIVGSLLLTGGAQISLVFAKAWVPYIIAMSMVGFLNSVTMPAISAFIGFRWPKYRYRLFNLVYVSNNAGVALGTTLAGVLAAVSFNLTFWFNGLSTLLFGSFFYLFLRKTAMEDISELPTGSVGSPRSEGSVRLLVNYRNYLFMGLGSLLITLSTSAWISGVAPFLNQQGLPLTSYSFLWTVNGVVILVGQPLTTLLNRFVTQSLYARLVASGSFYAVGFALMLFWHGSYIDFVVGMVITTFGEMMIAPTTPALITQTTGRDAPFYLGAVGGLGSAGRLLGPLVFGNLFDGFGLEPILWITSASTCGAVVFFFFHRQVRPQRYVRGSASCQS
ncbi:MFS transporter [Alicyclobacillaceae bacterium I2511]|nr:MFS transporter [Alicyclobacillaceae bacterium I2511]